VGRASARSIKPPLARSPALASRARRHVTLPTWDAFPQGSLRADLAGPNGHYRSVATRARPLGSVRQRTTDSVDLVGLEGIDAPGVLRNRNLAGLQPLQEDNDGRSHRHGEQRSDDPTRRSPDEDADDHE